RDPPHLHSFPTRRSSDLAPKARRKYFSLSADVRALSASKSRHLSRISGSVSLSRSSSPLLIAPTGLSRSWHSLEQSSAARSTPEDRKSTRLNSSHVTISY